MSASSDLPRRWPDRSLPEPEMKLRYLFAVGLLSVLGACSKSHEATPAEPAATPVETAVPAVAAPAPEATRAESAATETPTAEAAQTAAIQAPVKMPENGRAHVRTPVTNAQLEC